ncbi:dimethylsulfoniopropionate demethylase [Chromatiales bacterium (ex Bugula neritina AB1)]|nr:dimethylsulfoniopropionate demethylase [Chromatiales bacterium (ex Bugula neritina AB1)]
MTTNRSIPKLAVSRRLRSTPYTPRIEALGVSDYSIVNHTVLPKGFGRSTQEDYWHLREHVQLWDVSCQRQVEIKGVDAARLVQLMTPRDLSKAKTGQCLYAPLVDEFAGMINDPVILKLADDHYWLSIADSDVLLWAKGLALGFGLNVNIDEPDVAPLAVQGPKAEDLMARVFGETVRDIRFFRFSRLDFKGRELIVARSGYSRQGGFEIYLDDSSIGLDLWDTLWEAGSDLDVAPGSPNLIERVEGGLLSYGNEFTRENNPLECGLLKYCSFADKPDYIGKKALHEINQSGPVQQIRGIVFDGKSCPPCASTWSLKSGRESVGHISTAIWSPRLQNNVALGMVSAGYWRVGQELNVECGDGTTREGSVVDLPMM